MKYEYCGKMIDDTDALLKEMEHDLSNATDEEWIDYINDEMGKVKICGLEYDAGYALHEVDPTAFRCACADTEDTLMDDVRYAVNHLKDGDVYYLPVVGYELAAHEDESDDEE